eukprot:SAG22_NODE_2230_length_2811_cov_1.654499_3_plen_89_part_00
MVSQSVIQSDEADNSKELAINFVVHRPAPCCCSPEQTPAGRLDVLPRTSRSEAKFGLETMPSIVMVAGQNTVIEEGGVHTDTFFCLLL